MSGYFVRRTCFFPEIWVQSAIPPLSLVLEINWKREEMERG